MEEIDFYNSIQTQFEDVLPFVVYRKPLGNSVEAFLQEDDILHLVNDFSESGFVFAPFDNISASTVLIPITSSQHISSDVSSVQERFVNKSKILDIDPNKNLKEKHIDIVTRAIAHIKETEMRKVVLSRKQNISTDQKNPIAIFKRLLKAYPTAFVYCWYHPKVGLWLGATPETLVSIKNRQLFTMSLAGTQKSVDGGEVIWGEKEKEEQQLVTDSIVQNLEQLVDNLNVSNVMTHKAGSLLHLKTDITATVDTSRTPLKHIIEALHPTPAVCGLPKSLSKKFILANEGYNRNYYTGFLGELNLPTNKLRSKNRRNVENLAYRSRSKQTELFVNLRCMEVDVQGAQLYVGGGITAASDPEAEWHETVNKLQTVGRVLQSEEHTSKS